MSSSAHKKVVKLLFRQRRRKKLDDNDEGQIKEICGSHQSLSDPEQDEELEASKNVKYPRIRGTKLLLKCFSKSFIRPAESSFCHEILKMTKSLFIHNFMISPCYVEKEIYIENCICGCVILKLN